MAKWNFPSYWNYSLRWALVGKRLGRYLIFWETPWNWFCLVNIRNKYVLLNFFLAPQKRLSSVAGPGEGPRGPGPPLFLDQTEAQRDEKCVFKNRPPLISGSGWPPPPPSIWRSGSATNPFLSKTLSVFLQPLSPPPPFDDLCYCPVYKRKEKCFMRRLKKTSLNNVET